ncbi:MAG TPA: tetratricopeptide repeat protein [Candidatus Ozemobacteraceae bacterium]|nr:tetratricopeptide repeat protein [Candidatus Ozemobacteraceae bacterium]
MGPSESEVFARSQFRLPVIVFFGVFCLVIASIEVALGQGFMLTLGRGAGLILGLSVALTATAILARRIVDALLERTDQVMPTVVLWLYPLVTLGCTWILSWILLRGIPEIAGRGFWTGLIRLNAKTVTGAFTGPFLAFFLLLLAWTIGEAWRYLSWSIGWGEFVARLSTHKDGPPPVELLQQRRERQQAIQIDRERARRCNRWGMLAIFLTMIGSFVWIVFFRPELILYYRGMAQLRSFHKPDAALAMFEQLVRRYPGYRYLDTVKYHSAWVQERRLGNFAEAARAYEAFLAEYGTDNVWADDVVASLVRIALDKSNDPAAALRWTGEYRRLFPDGIMAPQVALYEVRALQALGRPAEAAAALAVARDRFGTTDVILYDSEDDFAGRIGFDAAATAAIR